MPAAIPTLSNCYVPLTTTLALVDDNDDTVSKKRSMSGGRPSGDMKSERDDGSLRYLCLHRSVLSRADGSSLVELGHTKVICRVTYGPSSLLSVRNHSDNNYYAAADGTGSSNANLHCEVRYCHGFGVRAQTNLQTAPTNIMDDSPILSNQQQYGQELEYSSRLREAILPSLLDIPPHSIIHVSVVILQADGSIFPACVTAATLALADAAVPLKDLVSSCSVAVIQSDHLHLLAKPKLLLDPNEDEEIQTQQKDHAIVTLSMLSNKKEVTFWDQTGRISSNSSAQALDLCKDGCMAMHKFIRHCLVTAPTIKKHDIF